MSRIPSFRPRGYGTYQAQTVHRDELRRVSKEGISAIVDAINSGGYENETVALMLKQLAETLKGYSGKKVYGYLPKQCKNLVNGIVDELAKDERIAKLYALWYEQKENIFKTYTQTMPEKVPLSQNEEFKSIRNAVVTEAFRIALDEDIVEETQEENIIDYELFENKIVREGESEWSPKENSPEHFGSCYATGVVRLLRYMGKILENNIRDDKTGDSIDKKLRRQINEKKQAQGLKMG